MRLPLPSLLEQVPAKSWFYGTGTRTTSVSNAVAAFSPSVTNKWFSNWPSSPGRQWYSLDLDSGWTVEIMLGKAAIYFPNETGYQGSVGNVADLVQKNADKTIKTRYSSACR